MLDTFRKLRALLSPREQRQALLLLGMMMISALLEVAGIASVMPFIIVLTDPSIIHSNPALSLAYDSLGFADGRAFLIALGGVLLFTFLASLSFRGLTLYAIQRYSSMRLHSLGKRLLGTYLDQPYEFFLNSNSATLSKKILSEVANVANGVLLPLMRAISGLVVSVSILALLLLVQPVVSLVMGASLGATYALIFAATKTRTKKSGSAFVNANTRRYVVASEALQGYKELKVLGRLEDYLARFDKPSKEFAKQYADNQISRELPYFFVQAIAFGGIITLLLVLAAQGRDLTEILPLVSFFAFAGYRLLPAFQDIFRSVGQLRFYLPALEELYADIARPVVQQDRADSDSRLPLEGSIEVVGISFRYAGAERTALNNVSITINAGTKVGLIGKTGAGKSTLVDLLLGLITPQSGQILVDGVSLSSANSTSWQRNIGYVPQSIFLADDSIAANIAFGVPEMNIDIEKVEQAARQAQIHEFIEHLPQGYGTIVGERGSRLSGGQVQRIGIARALYNQPDVLVLDEATSALDTETEAAVMRSIDLLQGAITIIVVAHRLSTVRGCSSIFEVQRGEVFTRRNV
ncbi:ABC transporter ATP-binding protein/permease [Devosia sp. XJ19-1]|uniref:ABC transporter ATP-binding protein/permease n=1 Tax=Devosia ureilytica TaxID=2952754 RepID=A0A9Q4AK77_9HYPH|nr:ABC transporter ATP-binding protein [Devosia ureilytica]MCP8882620.1 ABC transporter ATP-binding protein/permease [Devosia ureilytica]MCP8885493.1 ABC transporter ATP-binding protein/permease [Devosia ureilytica]